jgi:hypothetical protein
MLDHGFDPDTVDSLVNGTNHARLLKLGVTITATGSGASRASPGTSVADSRQDQDQGRPVQER